MAATATRRSPRSEEDTGWKYISETTRSPRQEDHHRRTRSRTALGANRAAVCFDQATHDGEAESRSRRTRTFVEAIEDARQFFFRDAGTCIDNTQLDAFGSRAEPNHRLAAARCVAQRVDQQIRQDIADAHRIDGDGVDVFARLRLDA